MKDRSTERCEFCGGQAVAFQHGARVCGRCGTRRTLGESPVILPHRSRRAAFISLLSSGLLLKLMMGSVALAAVGGFAAVSIFPTTGPTLEATDSTLAEQAITEATLMDSRTSETSILTDSELDEIVLEARGQAESASELATAAKDWANCVADFAQEHRGEGVHPQEICGEHPRPSEYGLGSENGNRGSGHSERDERTSPEDQGNSADAPGHNTTEVAVEPEDESEKDKTKEEPVEAEGSEDENEDKDKDD